MDDKEQFAHKYFKHQFLAGIRLNNITIIKDILILGYIPQYILNEAFLMMCQNGQLRMISLLIEDGKFNPIYKNNSGMKFAAKKSFFKIMKLLWDFDIVKNTLKNDNKIVYNIMIQQDVKNKIGDF